MRRGEKRACQGRYPGRAKHTTLACRGYTGRIAAIAAGEMKGAYTAPQKEVRRLS